MRSILILSMLFLFQCGSGDRAVNTVSAVNQNSAANSSTDNQKDNKAMENNTISFDDIKHNIDIKKVGNEYIEITYKLTNKGKNSYLVFNQGDTNKGLGNGKVYVEPLADGTIELSQKRFVQPAGKSCPNFEIAVTPGASWLKPDETITQTVKTGLPLRVFFPFDACMPKTAMPDQIKGVKFCIGIAEADPAKVKINDQGFVENLSAAGVQTLLCNELKNF